MTSLDSLPLRADLRGATPYGAPMIDVPVRLNVNENAFDVPEVVVRAIGERIAEAAGALNRYPDREFAQLRERLAGYLTGVLAAEGSEQTISPAMVWAANGSNEVLLHILQAFGGPGRTALGFVPSYSMHPLVAQASGASFIAVERDAGFGIDAETAAAAVAEHDPDVVFLCTPNNPTGNSTPLEVVEAVYAAARGIVIVDEAYAEFADEGFRSALSLLPGRERLVVSRTMSKAFAFAGARVGYAAADPAFVDALRLVRMPYHLSALTQAAAIAALDHTADLLAGVRALVAQRRRMAAALEGLGFEVVDSDANFVLFRGARDPRALWQGLVDAGVLVRDVGLPGCLRVNAGTEEETTAFLTAVTALVGQERQTTQTTDRSAG
ncbi:histidinol-phosphate transaminase [Brevibacterium album]|uniref:histidinol-phosphate transaminase n=1 Tax=Brevibacterium album TaxID=417948 RepID=UPI00068492BE|nr:histidinol-phosphate transaminase [Brevibacterium album]